MPASIVAEATIQVGIATFIEAASPLNSYTVVFEDDGATGYFYACDMALPGDYILDAMHIYNVQNVTDKYLPSEVAIAWSEDGLKAGLFINRYPHAIFDFSARRGYCRTNFPPPGSNWASAHNSHKWDDNAVNLLR